MSSEFIAMCFFIWFMGLLITGMVQTMPISGTTFHKILNAKAPGFYRVSAITFLFTFWPVWLGAMLVMGPIALFKITKEFKDEKLKEELEQLIKRAEKISRK